METKIGTRMRKRSPRTDKPECQNRKQIDTRIRPHSKSCFWKSALLDPNFFGKASFSVVGGGSRENNKPEVKIDNFTPSVLGIWKNLPIFASYRSALWKKTLNCLKS